MEQNEINSRVNTTKEESIDFGKVFRNMKRSWWLFAISLVICLLCAALYIYVKKPLYLVHAKIVISNENTVTGAGDAIVKGFGIGGGGGDVNDEIEVISAQSIRAQMVKDLRLNRTYTSKQNLLKKRDYYNDSPIEVYAPDALFDTLTVTLKFKIEVSDNGKDIHVKVKKGMFRTLADVHATKFPVIVKTEYGLYSVNSTKFYKQGEDITITAMVAGFNPIAEDYVDKLTYSLINKRSNAIDLYVDETNVRRGKDILNKIIDLYNVRGQEEKDETAVKTAKFIDERLNIIYDELADAEQQFADYKTKNHIISLEQEAGQAFIANKKAEETAQTIGTEVAILNMIYDFLRSDSNKNSLVPFVAENESAAKGIEMYNNLVLERQRIASTAKGDNAVLKSMDEQIANFRSTLLQTIKQGIDANRARQARFLQTVNETSGKISNIPGQEREYVELGRQKGIKSQIYQFLLSKREENELVLAANTPKGKIIDEAYAQNDPIAPKKVLVIALALFAGLLIPIIILYLKNLFSNKFLSQSELEEIVNAPVIGELCHNRHRDYLIVRADRKSSIVELFRLIRNNLQFMMTRKQDKVILVTSSVSGEGKSFVSTNIAATFALLEKRTLLIGLDIRSPKLAEYMQLAPNPGVTNFLSNEDVKFDEMIQRSKIDNMDIIVSGPVPPNPSELLLLDRLRELVDTAREKYEYIIIDSAPIGMVSDTFSLARYSDAVLYVTRANYTTKSNIEYLNQILNRGQLKNVAVILNDANPKDSYGYGYGYVDRDED